MHLILYVVLIVKVETIGVAEVVHKVSGIVDDMVAFFERVDTEESKLSNRVQGADQLMRMDAYVSSVCVV